MKYLHIYKEWSETFLRGDENQYGKGFDYRSYDTYEERESELKKYIRSIGEKEFPNGIAGFDFERTLKIYTSYIDYYGYFDKGLSEMYDHLDSFEGLYNKGGQVYRLIYVNSEDEIDRENLGDHWTISTYEIDTLANNFLDWGKMYGGGKKLPYMITLKTEPKNVSIDNVDVEGNPEEKEINIIDFNKTKIIDIKLYQ